MNIAHKSRRFGPLPVVVQCEYYPPTTWLTSGYYLIITLSQYCRVPSHKLQVTVSSPSSTPQVYSSLGPCSAQITNADFSNSEAVQRLADSWLETKANKALMAHLDSPPFAALPAQPKLTWTSRLKQLKTLTHRAAMNCSRDPAAYAFRCAAPFFILFRCPPFVVNTMLPSLWIISRFFGAIQVVVIDLTPHALALVRPQEPDRVIPE